MDTPGTRVAVRGRAPCKVATLADGLAADTRAGTVCTTRNLATQKLGECRCLECLAQPTHNYF